MPDECKRRAMAALCLCALPIPVGYVRIGPEHDEFTVWVLTKPGQPRLAIVEGF